MWRSKGVMCRSRFGYEGQECVGQSGGGVA